MTQSGRYDIGRKTGIRGVSAVYEAFDKQMQRAVTIRMAERRPTDPRGSEEKAREVIRAEARQLSLLDHPNIVKILSCEENDGNPLLVLEQFEGRPLREILEERGRLEPELVSKMLAAAAAGLDHAHSKGMVFRCLAPANLLISEDGLLKIAGFETSWSGQLDADPGEQELQPLLDALPYLSPEVLRGDPADGAADQYSLAAIGLMALTGFPPSDAASPVGQMEQGLFGQAPVAERIGAELPRGLAGVFQRALSKNSSGRYANCGEFVQAFESALAGKGSALTRVAAFDPAVEAPAQRKTPAPAAYTAGELEERLTAVGPRSLAPWIVGTAIIVVLAAAAAIYLLRSPASSSPASNPPGSNKAGVNPAAPAVTPAAIPPASAAPPAAPPPKAAAAPKKAAPPRPAVAKKKEVAAEPEPAPAAPPEAPEPDTRALRPKVRLADPKK